MHIGHRDILKTSIRHDGRVIMKTVCNGTPITAERFPPSVKLEPGTNKSETTDKTVFAQN